MLSFITRKPPLSCLSASHFVAEWNVMADEQGNARHRNFDGIYFWGMITTMFGILAVFCILALTSQVHVGHG